jgi:putative acetyltransferase
MPDVGVAELAIREAGDDDGWRDAASLLFAYQQETAVEVGAPRPARPEDVWLPVRRETVDPASVLGAYLLAYFSAEPVGGVALVTPDQVTIMLKRCYVVPDWRRRGVARALVDHAAVVAAGTGADRLVLDVLPSRAGAIAAWQRMGFVATEPWGDPKMVYFERRLPLSSEATPLS